MQGTNSDSHYFMANILENSASVPEFALGTGTVSRLDAIGALVAAGERGFAVRSESLVPFRSDG